MNYELYLNPKAQKIERRMRRSTDLVIAAHQDDIEIMCPQGILKGYQSGIFGLAAVVVTDGAGSPRAGEFANFSDEEMKHVRRQEQIRAAELGDYAELLLLNRTSAEVKNFADRSLTEELASIVAHYRPETVHIHNLADKHPTHAASAVRAIEAIRSLPEALRPHRLYGCEVWRGLDWMPDAEKVVFDLTGKEDFLRSLVEVFRSQIAGGKRYDLAAEGRRRANATYSESHGVDQFASAAFAMDLTPLILDDGLSIHEFIIGFIKRFADDIRV